MPERQQEHTTLGENLDTQTQRALRLAYQALKKTPEFVKRHQKIIGVTTVTSATAALVASSAINNLYGQKGQETPDHEILEGITEDVLLHEEHNMCNGKLARVKEISKTVSSRITSSIRH